MRILLTNDDGIDAAGITILAKQLKENGHEITIVAPDKEQSATSHSITLHQPLRIIKRAENKYAVTGSPADCIILASTVIKAKPFDLVISGINSGRNMGEDILYSGTVAAALEAMLMGYKAIAVSLTSFKDQNFEAAATILNNMLDNGLPELIGEREVFNINIPNIAVEEIEGIKITETGHRKYQDFVSEQKDPRGRKIYWIGGGEPLWSKVGDTDFKAIFQNYVSISPISPNFTNRNSFSKIQKWLDNIEK